MGLDSILVAAVVAAAVAYLVARLGGTPFRRRSSSDCHGCDSNPTGPAAAKSGHGEKNRDSTQNLLENESQDQLKKRFESP